MMAQVSTIRLALADDHAILRRSLISYLNSINDFEIISEGSNGKELIIAIETNPVKPHVCILDVSMPVMNGYDTLVAIKNRWPDILVLVLTMIDHEGNFLRMIRAGADGYMLKEEEPEELVRGIRFLAENGFYNSPSTNRLPALIRRSKKDDLVFSERDERFLRLCATELSYKQIAQVLGVTEKTVEGYRSALFRRLGVKSRTGLAFYALQIGLVPFGYENRPYER